MAILLPGTPIGHSFSVGNVSPTVLSPNQHRANERPLLSICIILVTLLGNPTFPEGSMTHADALALRATANCISSPFPRAIVRQNF